MKNITPFLWFDGRGEEAAPFYTSIFKNSTVLKTTRYSEAGKEEHGQKPGSVMTVEFEINGQRFVALNGGPDFKFNEAVSFAIECESQDEVDQYWTKLTADGGEESVCGWLKDKYGLSWQVTPTVLIEMLADPDRAKADRVMIAMMKMKKIDIAALKKAYAGS